MTCSTRSGPPVRVDTTVHDLGAEQHLDLRVTTQDWDRPALRADRGRSRSADRSPYENGRPHAPDRSRHIALKKPCHLPLKVTAVLAQDMPVRVGAARRP